MIRLTIPSIEMDDLKAVQEVIASTYLVQGKWVAAFEKVVADYVGTQYAVAVSNCTAALHLALLALNIGSHDLVLVTAYSWPATANVIELCGAQPVFVDIQPDTFNMDPKCLDLILDKLMTIREVAQRVKAILPVHTFGQMADMPAILKIAKYYNIPVVEDAACALGTSLNDKMAGTWGIMGCFSFHPRKAITTGEGGIISTNDAILVRRLRALRNHGLDPDAEVKDFILPGFNYRITEFQAALGTTQMVKLDRIIAARRQRADVYNNLFTKTPFQVPVVSFGCQPVYQSYVVLLPEKIASHRDEIIARMKELGIETTIGTWHIPMINYYRTRYGYRPGDFPVTDQIFTRSITLPIHDKISETEQEQVVKCLLGLL